MARFPSSAGRVFLRWPSTEIAPLPGGRYEIQVKGENLLGVPLIDAGDAYDHKAPPKKSRYGANMKAGVSPLIFTP